MGQGDEFSKPSHPPGHAFPTTSSSSGTNWKPSVQIPRPMEDILIQAPTPNKQQLNRERAYLGLEFERNHSSSWSRNSMVVPLGDVWSHACDQEATKGQVGLGYKVGRLTPGDSPPPVGLHLLRTLYFSKTAPPGGD